MKVILMNEEQCQKDLHPMWDITNVEQVKEKLNEFKELTEGELVHLLYVQIWSEYHPFGLFKFIGMDKDCMKFQYLEIEWL
ncbi:hypothetical protein HCJ02_14655 [Listeria seeligeri]|uniref:hypothetical protein n=1 Tax=Listeria seeligeri TaxID=1640 RepID=UPI0010DCD809|nr:hypothetical protein [Listeria seeligeri]EAD3476087.1 hypothetical protein [Listeria monocytogenes]EAG4636599.1 hypothetical protein [Listeria monocytogenes]EAH4084469.1 hypothetical protein [Listeria monocytogenes]EEO9180091.1 hypothetical protein [Listeria monocytogenes]EIF6131968.1 hypothetical protein [Listeria monocytogenes]